MRKHVLFLLAAFGLFFATVLVRAAHSAVNVPFGGHSFAYAAHIAPSNATQAQRDTATQNFYTAWRNAYLLAGCTAGHYRINYDGANQTVSEAHGYGMLAFVLMAGYDANAKTYFDGMYQFYRAHPAIGGASRLLAWKQNAACANIEGPDSASDGDLDIAMALLMADRQWGSCGAIDYRGEALAMLVHLKQYDLNSTYKYVKLGSWATTGNYLNSTRSSDFMPSHYRSFQWATGDNAWNGLIDYTYYLVTATAHTTTGLIPDFISNPLTSPAPAPANFLESPEDGKYNWNACRDPWRLATDYLVSGDIRGKNAVQKIITWAKTAPINGNPNNVRAGYELNGTALVAYGDLAFTSPLAVGAMVDASNQTLLNSFWTASSSATPQGYFGDSIKLISMIVLSGNWWQPEAMPDPCAVGTPTFTATRTPSRTATPSVTAGTGAACPIVLAYYPSWNQATYNSSHIPYNKLTHICHAFIWPEADGSLNIPASINEPALISNAHAQGTKVLISVGGATGSGNFSVVANNAGLRNTFIANLKAFVLSRGYDGVDFDWEFPQNASDRASFTLLVQEIRNAFNSAPNAHPEWLITGAYSWTSWYAQWYDLTALVPLVDFFNVMTYDAHGSWSAHSGHNAPLGAAAGDSDTISMQAAINYYVTTRGVPAAQVVFGVPFYGYNFPTENLHGACATCGTDTQSVAYKDILALIGNGWTYTWDASATSPYLRHDSQARLISYDNPQSIEAKADWALNTRGLGGVFMWDLSHDHVSPGVQPLLDAMRVPLACGSTPTHSSTRTRTATPSPTRTSTPSASRSATPSVSRTVTPSPSVTSTFSASVTPSSSSTRSATASFSTTPSITVSFTGSATPNGSLTDSPSATPSPSITLTASSSSTANGTATSSTTPSFSATATPSHSGSPTATGTTTITAAASASASHSPTPSLSVTSTRTVTTLSTSTASTSPTISPSPATNTPTHTQVPPTATWTPTAADGPLVVLACVPGPNPNPTRFSIHMAGPADELDLKIYDRSMRCVLQLTQVKLQKGWNQVLLPSDFAAASNGTYFFRVQCRRAGRDASKPLMGRLVVLK